MFRALPDPGQWRSARLDLIRGLSDVRLWWLLGQTDMRQRYSRSRLGPFWITLSMAMFIAGIGVVNASLFRQDVATYLPRLAASYLTWTLISTVLLDSTQAYVQAAGFLRQMALPKTVFVLRVMVRQIIAFAHNVVILPVVFVLLGPLPGWSLLAWPFGLALVLVALFGQSMALAVLATRFRDLPQLVQNLMQIAMFVTPVFWRPDQLGPDLAWVLVGNPFAVMMQLSAEPLLGRMPPPEAWAAGLVVTLLSLALGLGLFARFRARIVYWL